MKKKILSLTAALFVLGASEGFSIGLGLQLGGDGVWGGNWGGLMNLSFLVSLSDTTHISIPLEFNAGNKAFNIGANIDWWLLNPNLTTIGSTGKLNFFLGPGLGAVYSTWSGGWNLAVYGRLPVGLDLKFRRVDVFVQAVPAIGLNFHPFYGPAFRIGGHLGARFWL